MNRILNEVKNNVLTDESKWCQEHFAVNKAGSSVSETASTATRFCMLGACKKVAMELYNDGQNMVSEHGLQVYNDAVDAILVVIRGDGGDIWGLGSFNDYYARTFDEVMQVFDTAIIMTGGSDEESPS